MRTISTAINYTPRVFLRVDLRRQGTKGGAKQKKNKEKERERKKPAENIQETRVRDRKRAPMTITN